MRNLEQLVKTYLYTKHKPKIAKLGFCIVQATFVVLAFAFALFSFFLWLSLAYEPYIAALIVAGSLLGMAVATKLVKSMYMAYVRYKARNRRAEIPTRESVNDEFEELLLMYADDIKDLATEYPKASITLGLVAGYFLSDKVE